MDLGSRLGISTLLSGALLLPLSVIGPASAAVAAEADEHIEKATITVSLQEAQRYIWCPASHPWARQTVQNPVAADGEGEGWYNQAPGLNAKAQDDTIRITDAHMPTGHGQWGFFVTVKKDFFPAGTRSVELSMHCTNNRDYNPYGIKITGTPPPMPSWGVPYDYQLTLTGPGNPKVNTAEVAGLPPGLTISETGRITGTLKYPQWDDHIITVPISSDYITIRPGTAQFTLPGTPA